MANMRKADSETLFWFLRRLQIQTVRSNTRSDDFRLTQIDPLNWSPRRKALSTVCMCVYTLMVGIASAAIYSVLEPISDATGLTLADLNAGTGYMYGNPAPMRRVRSLTIA